MSKAVLLSIQPNWCKMIWAGMKEVEVRKTRPTLETPFKAYIYCTGHDGWVMKSPKAGVQKMDSRVIGEFTCDKIDKLVHVGTMRNLYHWFSVWKANRLCTDLEKSQCGK